MVDNPTIPLDSIKSRMDDLFIFSSQVPYGCKHPLRVVQASKSLIGINIEDPSRQLLKWLDDYVKDFTPNFNPPILSDQNLSLETITYTHLENLILHKKKSESKIYLTQLLQVADPRHIAEFLMELSVQQAPGTFLFCWSAFRSLQFLGDKDGYPILYHCLSSILKEISEEKSNTKLLMERSELYCHQFQIRKTEIIRKNKIIPHLDKMIRTIKKGLNKTYSFNIPKALGSMIITEGEMGILSYLATLKMEDISSELILLLDAIRSALKFSDNLEDPVLLSIFNNFREKVHAK